MIEETTPIILNLTLDGGGVSIILTTIAKAIHYDPLTTGNHLIVVPRISNVLEWDKAVTSLNYRGSYYQLDDFKFLDYLGKYSIMDIPYKALAAPKEGEFLPTTQVIRQHMEGIVMQAILRNN